MTPDTKLRPENQVREMFARVAPHYDAANRAMCFFMDILWRRDLVKKALSNNASIGADSRIAVLDLACGSGDVACILAARLGNRGMVCALDFCPQMLDIARRKAASKKLEIEFTEGDCAALPYPDNSFNALTLSFGFRNFRDRKKCLGEAVRVLKPNGVLAMLEVSKAPRALAFAQKTFMTRAAPAAATLLGANKADYLYLAKTTLEYPENREIKNMFLDAGFARADIFRKAFGLVAITRGVKGGD